MAQGVGTWLVGGSWIGVALPLGGVPWGVVNEPGVAFAASRAALAGYWLPPLLLPAVLALLLPWLAPSSGRWPGELAIFHLSAALALLALTWGVPLGVADGPARGLETFWRVPNGVTVAAAGLVAAISGSLAVVRLAAHFWHAPGGPTRRRRLALVLVHLGVPTVGWLLAVRLLGFPLLPGPCRTLAAVLAGIVVAAALLVPRPAIYAPPALGAWRLAILALVALPVLVAAAAVGSAGTGRGTALLWGRQGPTSNLRPGVVAIELTRRPVPTARPGSSAAGS